MPDPAPQFDHVERAALNFVADKLTSGCPAIQRDSLELFLADHGAGTRAVAICKLFLVLGIFEPQVLPKYPVFTHELGSLDKSEKESLLAFHQQAEAARNLYRISGKAILFQRSLETSPAAPPPPPAGAEMSEGGKPNADAILPVMLSASDIATRIKRNPKSVTSFLTRFAGKNRDCRIEIASKRKNEPTYMYRTADVWPALEKWMKDDSSD